MQLDERTEHWLTDYPFVTKIDYDISLLHSDSIVKRIVRSAYHLILEEDQSFVHDLETLRPILLHYFPDEPRFWSLFAAYNTH